MQHPGYWLLLPIQEGGGGRVFLKGGVWPLLREACRSNGSLNPFMKRSLGSADVHMAGKEQRAEGRLRRDSKRPTEQNNSACPVPYHSRYTRPIPRLVRTVVPNRLLHGVLVPLHPFISP